MQQGANPPHQLRRLTSIEFVRGMSLFMARCGHAAATTACLLLGDERTYLRRGPRSEFGPKVSQALTFQENCLRSA